MVWLQDTETDICIVTGNETALNGCVRIKLMHVVRVERSKRESAKLRFKSGLNGEDCF